jgi:hypothetical protein
MPSWPRPALQGRSSCVVWEVTLPILSGAVEGDLDEAVLHRIVRQAGLSLAKIYGRQGKTSLLRAIRGYNAAAHHASWIVLVDLDRDCECAPPCARRWLPDPAPHMCFRLVVRSIEAWLLADGDRVANFLGVPRHLVPHDPDALDDPKRALVDLARRSRRRALRDEIVPRAGSGRSVGPLYTTRMIEFVQDEAAGWRVDHALGVSNSLTRCVTHLRRLAENASQDRESTQEA